MEKYPVLLRLTAQPLITVMMQWYKKLIKAGISKTTVYGRDASGNVISMFISVEKDTSISL